MQSQPRKLLFRKSSKALITKSCTCLSTRTQPNPTPSQNTAKIHADSVHTTQELHNCFPRALYYCATFFPFQKSSLRLALPIVMHRRALFATLGRVQCVLVNGTAFPRLRSLCMYFHSTLRFVNVDSCSLTFSCSIGDGAGGGE